MVFFVLAISSLFQPLRHSREGGNDVNVVQIALLATEMKVKTRIRISSPTGC
jgi:hypothetical protein